MFPVVRAEAGDQRPEATRVVHHLKMADLVPNDVVEHRLRREEQPPVEAHGPIRAATRPPGALVADRQSRVGAAGHAAGVVEFGGDIYPSATTVEPFERWQPGGPGGNQQQVATAMDACAAGLSDQTKRLAQVRHLLSCMHAATGYGP